MPFTTNVLSSYFKMAGLSTKDVMKKYYSLDVPEDEVRSSIYEILFPLLLSYYVYHQIFIFRGMISSWHVKTHCYDRNGDFVGHMFAWNF